MKKLLPILFLFTTLTIALSSCTKDETCHARIYVENTLGQEQYNIWVKIDIAQNTPGGNFTDRVPVQLNTLQDGYVDVDFALPAILQVSAYAANNPSLTNPPIGQKMLKLVPGERVSVTVIVP